MEVGERVLVQAVDIARGTWGNRLLAAYALGSLAHGGFSIHVSDVDLGLVLDDPLTEADASRIRELSDAVKAGGAPLSDRLSVFWGSPDTLSNGADAGRFPPLDRLDLKRYGRFLAGRDVRARFPEPTLRELVVSSAEFALRQLSRPEVAARLRDPAVLARAALKPLTKQVLYPVRFLYTARTGDAGMNEEAVANFLAAHDGPAATLARNALAWRIDPPRPGSDTVVQLLRNGLLPLYRIFLEDYEQRMCEHGELDLARRYGEWRQQLAQSDETRGFPVSRE